METAIFIIATLVAGLILGSIARFLVPGEQRLSLAETAIIGMVGAAVSAAGANVLTGSADPDRIDLGTVVAAVLGSLIVLTIFLWLASLFGWRDKPKVAITDVIAAGESSSVEFKSTSRINLFTGERDDKIELAIARTVAGFLNGDGGILVIGVDDNG